MSEIRIPTALRSYTEGQERLQVEAATVEEALQELTERFPALAPHLFNEGGELRPYVSLFLNDQDVRTLSGHRTPLSNGDRLMILPSIAGGAQAPRESADESAPHRSVAGGAQAPTGLVDNSAMQTSMAARLGLLLAAFIADGPWLVAVTAALMLIGTLRGKPDLVFLYRLLRRLGWIAPDLVPDNPEPHRFSQGIGAAFLSAASLAFAGSLPLAGWALAWIVIALTALNLFGGFCVGCAVYYWLNRVGAPGFDKSPPPGVFPGRRPTRSQ